MADDIEQKLKFIIEATGVKETKKSLDKVSKSSSFLKKHMLGIGIAVGAAAAAMGLLFRSSSVVQSVMGAVNDIFFGFVDMILVELMPVLEPLIVIFQEILAEALEDIIPIIRDLVVWFKDNFLPVLQEYQPELKEIVKAIGLLIAAGMIGFLIGLTAALIGAGEIVRDLKIAFTDLWNNVLVPVGNFLKDVFQGVWDSLLIAFNLIKVAVDTIGGAFQWL